ncbi:hypothetical protein BATDEDRAFT_15466 [Batrachochytrium dendrobatidis JAM81]|uniref:Cation-transporting P-type ATPase N-terminal domain-containing protein n=1 Tax=Batrachochytrium dendrobatidis (strain JAM81 / FGSC 10211) TaxID=684364 RepID=F4NV96_BATDJ|nr:uncharacterized protein BATDEDRAFT_15466 [Batrachochytrium dendrobatidis JAM81]EGF84084.1 hypothetical protein BATDEDRAFT_15466 [Batrachochytrium dendrobatidis JAM81]|eukprot:XP_006675121.1 hypothetical protein BATDEDRAFT_15466 [Batrachochytrium dendrobatidis JAM81]
MKLHRRCQPRSTKAHQETAMAVLGLLTTRIPQFSDWRELVKEDEHDDVERLISQFPEKFQTPKVPFRQHIFPPPSLYFDKNSERLAEMYGSNTERGLPSDRIVLLREHYGFNKLPNPPKPSIFGMIFTQITDFMVLILIIAAIVEFATKDSDSAIVLLIVVVLNVTIGTYQEFKANRALEALLTLSVPKATVIRDGIKSVVESRELVPGDLVTLEEGDAVPADLRLCESAQLEIIEVILTGEALPISKSIRTIRKRTRRLPLGDCKGSAFMTTVVAKGRGKGIVVRTGISTEIGKISQAISSTPHQKSNIEKKLSTLGQILVAIALILVVIIICIGLGYKRSGSDMLKVGISLGVSVIPEGLVAVVTVAMALGVSRMASKHAIVRKLPSVETLGSVTVICSDKTGTLTEGKMGAQVLWTSDNSSFVMTHSTSLDPEAGVVNILPSPSLTSAMSSSGDPPKMKSLEATASSKDIQQMPSHLAASMTIAALCCNASIVPGLNKIGEYAFDSDRKLMSVIYQQGASKLACHLSQDSAFVLAKGAPECVLSHCVSYLGVSDSNAKGFNFMDEFPTHVLDDAFVDYISKRSSIMASSGLRVLALAMRKVTADEGLGIAKANSYKAAESQLVFVGLIGLIDPPKEGVKESVATCKRAGIRVIMITGDHIATASAIAKQLGILEEEGQSNSRAMKGYEIDLLSEEQLAEQRPFPAVFARVSPDNKLKIVKALQSKGHSVAMTGDGVNDAPAIKRADVGVAMGIGGTEITKQAADIVLADDNFATIVDAVKEGRQVFDNIKKFVVYLLSCNSAEIFLFLMAALANLEMPFTTMQILWANIIADIPPAMSIGLEPAEKNIMDRKPRPANEGVLTILTSVVVLLHGLMMSSITFGIYIWMENTGLTGIPMGEAGTGQRRSTAFMVLTVMQLVQSFHSRSVEESVFVTGIFGNLWMVGAFLLSFALALIGLLAPGISTWLNFEPVTAWGWLVVFISAIVQSIFVELVKVGVRYCRKKGINPMLPPIGRRAKERARNAYSIVQVV